jgi:D-glycero-alpha-D-manno-heptose 1-phosphate guanylyltransferase
VRLEPGSIPVLVLGGGLGTRLRSAVPDLPKILAPVAGRAYIDILLDKLRTQGFRRFVLAVGHMRDLVIRHFDERTPSDEVLFSSEDRPLGTGGAVWNARAFLDAETFVVLNGDSDCDPDFAALAGFHFEKRGLCSIVLAHVPNGSQYGEVTTAEDGRVTAFLEKQALEREAWVNGGVYMMQREVLRMEPPDAPFSLERELFPRLVAMKEIWGMRGTGRLLDIGTPERYAEALRRFGKS